MGASNTPRVRRLLAFLKHKIRLYLPAACRPVWHAHLMIDAAVLWLLATGAAAWIGGAPARIGRACTCTLLPRSIVTQRRRALP
jgi:hypothetical protein